MRYVMRVTISGMESAAARLVTEVLPVAATAQEGSIILYFTQPGDTLWDIAQSYYNNPWLYKRIATANNIKNPDHIVAGTILVIPPQ